MNMIIKFFLFIYIYFIYFRILSVFGKEKVFFCVLEFYLFFCFEIGREFDYVIFSIRVLRFCYIGIWWIVIEVFVGLRRCFWEYESGSVVIF